MAIEGYWECVKEVLWCIIDTKAGMVALPEYKLQELRDLLKIPVSRQRMGRKDLERLVGKLCSMHLAISGAVALIYHIQRTMSQARIDRAWMSTAFHRKIVFWKILADKTSD